MSIVCGAIMPRLERSPFAATHPLNTASAAVIAAVRGEVVQGNVPLGPGVRIAASDGSLSLQNGRTVIWLQPLLSFESRSPDGCWTIFSPRDYRRSPPRTRLGAARDEDGGIQLQYADVGRSTLTAHTLDGMAGSTQIEASTQLPTTVFSHLNSFTQIELAGHHRLSLAFSPCREQRVDVCAADFPVGRPARCAYLDAGGVFHVVEAHSGEKGPFHELARGPLARVDALAIGVFDDNDLVCTITMDDWASQADTTLSPTAGWGLPTNAIEFHLEGDSPTSPAELFVTLAATSVGRGWDTVAHAPGTYRNRMRVEFAGPFKGSQ
jgi:hypothetical protein